jgi:hypothetical protein
MKQIVINQHYIPRSYLKNFGFIVNPKKKKWSLYAMEYGGEIKRRTTENVCSVDYLYDLPLAEGEERQFLEHAYELHADRNFTEITKFIIADSNKHLPEDMRDKILKSCLSLYFRTPKFVDFDQLAYDSIQSLPEEEKEEAWKIKKTDLLFDSVSNFEKLYEGKRTCVITVCKAVGKWDFISGDNPVIIRNLSGKLNNVFAEDNMIFIPLTPRYLISILPPSEISEPSTLYRNLYDDDMVMTINHDIEMLHQRYLLGSQESLNEYLKEVPYYKAPVQENDPKVILMKNRLVAMEHISELFKDTGGIITSHFKGKFKYYWDNLPGFKEDLGIQGMKKMLDEFNLN